MDDQKQNETGEAPRFMVLYCSIMILLLAFFIVIQSFATQQKEERFRSGQSSFKRALRTCGLGHLMDEYRRWVKGKASGPRFQVERGVEVPSDTRRIDVEREDASVALQKLAQHLEVTNDRKSECKSVLVAPLIAGKGKDLSGKGGGKAIRLFSHEVLPILLEQRCRIGIGGFYQCDDGEESRVVARALAKAGAVRDAVLTQLSSTTRKRAREKCYTFCSRVPPGDPEDPPEGERFRIDVFVRHFSKGNQEDDT